MNLFRKEALDHKSNKIWGEVLLKPKLAYEIAIKSITVTALLVLIFIFLGHYYTKETVQGFIEPKEGLISVYMPQSGYVEEILVHQGDTVEKNQILMKLSPRQFTSEGITYDDKLRQQYEQDYVRAQIATKSCLQEYQLRKKELHDSFIQARESLEALTRQYQIQDKVTKTLIEQYKRIQQAFEKGAVARIQMEQFEKEKNYAERELLSLEDKITTLHHKLNNQDLVAQQLDTEFAQKVLTYEQHEAEIQKRLTEIDKVGHILVIAPAKGTVTQINFKMGQYIQPGQHMIDILKEDDCFIAKLIVPSKSIGLIKIGQEVSMRVHAYPYEHYGTLIGKIALISESVQQHSEYPEPSYHVIVVLDRQSLGLDGKYKLKQGFLLDADIKTQQMTIVQKILEPIYRVRYS